MELKFITWIQSRGHIRQTRSEGHTPNNRPVCLRNVSHQTPRNAGDFFQIKASKGHGIQLQGVTGPVLDWENNCHKGCYWNSWQNVNTDPILSNNSVSLFNSLNMNLHCGDLGECHVLRRHILEYSEVKVMISTVFSRMVQE